MVSTVVKQVIVFFQIIFIMSTSFGFTNLPGSLQHDITKEFNIDTSQFGLLASLCNWAALIDVLHGYLLDRYLGIKLATFIYSILVLIGSAMFCIAGYNRNFPMFLAGRIIFGFGMNPLLLCTNKHIIYWFSHGKCINLVYSVNESFIWLGSSAVYFGSVNLLKYIEHYRSPTESLALTICLETSIMSILMITSSLILAYMYGCMDETQSGKENLGKSCQLNTEDSKNLTWRDYLILPWLFWTFTITIFIYLFSVLSFLRLSQVYFEETYHLTTTYASTLSGILTMLGFILSPLIGYIGDRFGHNLSCLTGAIFLYIISYGIFSFTRWNPIIPVCVMGVSTAISSSSWSQFQYLVDERQKMIAYGVVQTGLNGVLAVGILMSGVIIDKYGYNGFITGLFSLIICTFPALIVMWIFNYKNGNFLNLNPRNKLIYLGRN